MHKQTRIGLVACASQKLKRPAPARHLYNSTLFRKASAYAAAQCDQWYILSAKHGLVHPDTVLEPYDAKLATPTSLATQYWADRVRAQLAQELADVPRVLLVALAGERYRTVLHPCQWPYRIPMKGLGIGEQLSFLTRELDPQADERSAANHDQVRPREFDGMLRKKENPHG